MRRLKLIAKIFVVSILAISTAKAETKSECEANADFFGYATTLSAVCGYESSEKYSNAISQINKECVANFGNKFVFNASMAAVHEVKAKISEQGRNSVCADAHKELNWYFE